MIKDISNIFRRREHRTRQKEGLGFSISNSSRKSSVKEIFEGIERHIIRKGCQYTYVLDNAGISNSDMQAMEYAKAAVMSRLIGEPDMNIPSLEKAMDIACEELLGYVDRQSADHLSYFVAHAAVGCGPISILMEDKADIEEIEIKSPTLPISVYTSDYGRCQTNLSFSDEKSFRYYMNKFILESEEELDEGVSIVDAQAGEAPANAQIKEYTTSSTAASIRIGKSKALGSYSLLKNGTASIEILAYLWLAMETGMNIVISGAPASGKTTIMGALADFMPRNSRLIVIEEEINEFQFSGFMENVVSLYGSRYGNTDRRAQVLSALRMRPDRIVVGEIKDREANAVFSAAGLGIPFMTTVHGSDDCVELLKRLLAKPMAVEPGGLSMLDVFIYMRQNEMRSKVLSTVCEYRWLSRAEILDGMEIGSGDSVKTNTVVENGVTSIEAIANSKVFQQYRESRRISSKSAEKDLEKMVAFLQKEMESSGSDGEMLEGILDYRIGAVS